LSAIVKEGIRAAIGRRTLQEVVSAERTELMAEMLLQVQERPPELGIEVVDVRVKRIDLAEDVSESVFLRMRQERTAVATQLRSEGEEEYVRVRADADRQREVLLAEAYSAAQKVKGEGDAKASATYAQAFGQNPAFAEFYRTLEAYRTTFKNRNDLMVIDPSSEFFKYLRGSKPGTPPAKGGSR